MAHELPPLPYPKNALAPHMSAETLEFHHDKHHQTYIDTLNGLIAGTPLENSSLEDTIRETANNASKTAIFNNAAQAWNHDFFWRSMRPNGGGAPSANIMEHITKGGFENFAKFREAFINAAKGQFGSGWAWLVLEGGKFKVTTTSNADNPIAHNVVPLATCDVWEHAYYIDYRNRRADFVTTFIDILINWDFVAHNLARHSANKAA